jgi:hypothetical protein
VILDKYGSFFIKPSSEGNSRGCMKIENKDDLSVWLEEHSAYMPQGVLCEEILSEGNEFSFDGVNHTYWITQKFTTKGSHRAEYQHILPAPFSSHETDSIHRTLVPFLNHLGTRGGAFHHEFFLLPDNTLASVEPNRRPAGMWLWDLAEWSFEDFSPWKSWLDIYSGSPETIDPLRPKYFSGVRGAISRISGKIVSIDEGKIREELKSLFGNQVYKFKGFKKVGDQVTHAPKDNSDFLYFIATRNEKYEQVISNLKSAENIILNNIDIRANK